MKKQAPKTNRAKAETVKGPSAELPYFLILMAYAVITLITPNLGAFDSNGPKFLSLALLNLFAWLYLYLKADLKEGAVQWSFFSNKVGLAYTLFLLVMLISFSKAINLTESLISFIKYFSVFAAAFNLSVILRKDKKYLKSLSIVLALVLITDSFTVFYNILRYISHQIGTIYEIKSVYSNKNILTAALFIKIPFALWLSTFERGWLRKLGFFSLFSAILAILFMSARTFYVGLILLALSYGTYLVVMAMREKSGKPYQMPLYFFGALALAFLLFSGTQRYLFPKVVDVYNESFAQRVSSSFSGETSSLLRLDSWKRSGVLLKENPFLGVGTGNWKIAVLEYEGPTRSDFTYMQKNHNDFIEVAAETGIFGALLFLSLFVFLVMNFVIAFFRPGAQEQDFKYLFLPAFGIFCYSLDAFFNFPADRPEILSLFAIFIAAGIAFSTPSLKAFRTAGRWPSLVYTILTATLLLTSTYVLLLNFNSSKLQRLVYEDLPDGNLNQSSATFLQGFPGIPDIDLYGEPIAVVKSRYLISEQKYREAIDMLLPDHASPYDGRKDYFLSLAYFKKGDSDSALYYAYRARDLKPLHFTNLGFICNKLEEKGKKEEATKILEDYVKTQKQEYQAWMYLGMVYTNDQQWEDAARILDSALRYYPQDSTFLKKQADVRAAKRIAPYKQLYVDAEASYAAQKYPEALKLFSAFISKEPNVALTYARRAYCHYFAGDYDACIRDVASSLAKGNDTPDLLNLRGTCYHLQGKKALACADFSLAIERGNKEAVANAAKFCN